MKIVKSIIVPASLLLALGSIGCELEDLHDSTDTTASAVNSEHKKRSLHIFLANPSSDNDETRIWIPNGGRVELGTHLGGYFTDAYVLRDDIDLSGVIVGQGVGLASVDIADGGDPLGRAKVDDLYQEGTEIVAVYREYKQEDGVWENKKTVTTWGYIASAQLQAGPSSLSIEVHTVRVITQNDAIGTRDYSIDCITGSSTIRGGSIGARQPTPLDPPATPSTSNWGKLLNG